MSGPRVPWFYANNKDAEAFRKAITEIEITQSDRAAAIVVSSFLENQLTDVIQRRLHKMMT